MKRLGVKASLADRSGQGISRVDPGKENVIRDQLELTTEQVRLAVTEADFRERDAV
jgi:hypothetical protein